MHVAYKMTAKSSFVKPISMDDVIEPWIYNTFSHPAMLETILLEGKYSSSLQMTRGDIVPFDLDEQDFREMFGVLIEFVMFMEDHGVVYGDVKVENIIRLKGEFKIIDFGMMHFPRLPYTVITQTYIEDGPSLDARVRGVFEQEEDDSIARLLFAIGFLVFRWVNKIGRLGNLRQYQALVTNRKLYETCGKWTSLIKACMITQNVKCVRDLLPLIPFPIPSSPGTSPGKAMYTPTPHLPIRWNDSLDRYNSIFYGITSVCTSHDGIYPIAMQLYWRYMGVITNIKSDDDHKIRALYCACLAVACLLVGWNRLSIPTLAFHANIPLDLMKSFWSEFCTLLQHRLPSLFRDGYAKEYKSSELEVYYHRIGNPLNIDAIRTSRDPCTLNV